MTGTAADGAGWVLRVVDGPDQGRQVAVRGPVVIGRTDADLVLTDPHVSRAHAEVRPSGPGLAVRDLGSRRGIWIGPTQIDRERPLHAGDTFRIEPDTLMVLADVPPSPEEPNAQDLLLVIREPGRPGRQVRLPLGPVRFGRSSRADVVLEDVTVSGLHSEITPRAGQLVLRDLGSAHGTCLNDVPFEGEVPLHPGDVVTIGRSEVRLTSSDGAAGDAPPPLDLRLREEGGTRAWAVTVAAAGGSTVADVAAALAAYLGLLPRTGSNAPQRHWCLYRERGARLLDPAGRWAEAPLRRGDVLVLGPLAEPPAPDRQFSGRGPGRPAAWRVPRRGLPGSAVVVQPHPVQPPPVPEPVTWRGKGVLWQILGGLGMVGVGVGMAFVNPAFIVLAVLGGLATLWGIGVGLLGERSRAKRAVTDYRARLATLDAELTAVRADQTERLHVAAPPVEACATWPAAGHRLLWRRRTADADFLALRLGRGTRATLLSVDSFSMRSTSPLAAELTAVLDRHRLLADVPVTTPPAAGGVLGVTGESGPAAAMARALLVQAAALHSPTALPVAVLATDDAEAWTRWLPHVEDDEGPRAAFTGADADALAGRLTAVLTPEGHGARREPPRMLLFVDAVAAARPPVRALLEVVAQNATALAVVLGARERLPATTSVLVDCRGALARLLGPGVDGTPFTAEGLSAERAAAFARDLAPYTDADAAAAHEGTRILPQDTGLLELLGVGDPASADPGRLWSKAPPVPLGSPVGVTPQGTALALSFDKHGPHGLLAGMTGSGKSVFLQTFLAGIAATHSPESVNFFLADFKGGAAFEDLAGLPHVVGMVTNLGGGLAERAITSLSAELVRRQTLFKTARVSEFREYRPDPARGLEPLPRLLVVIDEFAMLKEELGDEVTDQFFRIAMIGRSLGVHMLLAMQSPSGVVKGPIVNNIGFQVCLRVANRTESDALLGRGDAAEIPESAPGRGYLRLGGASELTGFQTAQVTAPVRSASGGGPWGPVSVRPFADVRPAVSGPAQQPTADAGRAGLPALTQTLADRAAALGIPAPRPLWLPPLPQVLLPGDLDPLPDAPPVGRRSDRPDLRVRLGRADRPEEVAQPVLGVDLGTDGHLLVVGAYGAGKTSTLRHLAADLASRLGPDRLHLYAVDAGDGSLAPLEVLPQTAAVVGADDLERLLALFARLEGVVARRRAAVDTPADEPAVVLLLDDVAAFRETADGFQYGVLMDRLISLVRSGPAADVHVVLSAAQRTDLPSAVFNLFARKVLLRQTDPLDYDMVGVPSSRRPTAPAPGRAMVSGPPPMEAQVGWTDAPALEAIAAATPDRPGPRPVRRLPTEVLRSAAEVRPPAGGFLLGVGGAEVAPVVVDPERDGPVLTVAGSERSGRSTVLLTAAAGWRATDPGLPLTVLALRRSPVHALADLTGVTVARTPDEAAGALSALAARPSGTSGGLLVDDLESVGDAVLMALEPVLRSAGESGLVAVVAGRSTDLARSYDPASRYLRSLRTTLLLVPRSEDGELVGGRIPPAIGPQVPGRGLFYSRSGEPQRVQIALPG
jgi:DNA segregation ATPase FtsK/SpoIIIE, S-DNA-T family